MSVSIVTVAPPVCLPDLLIGSARATMAGLRVALLLIMRHTSCARCSAVLAGS